MVFQTKNDKNVSNFNVTPLCNCVQQQGLLIEGHTRHKLISDSIFSFTLHESGSKKSFLDYLQNVRKQNKLYNSQRQQVISLRVHFDLLNC